MAVQVIILGRLHPLRHLDLAVKVLIDRKALRPLEDYSHVSWRLRMLLLPSDISYSSHRLSLIVVQAFKYCKSLFKHWIRSLSQGLLH